MYLQTNVDRTNIHEHDTNPKQQQSYNVIVCNEPFKNVSKCIWE